MIDFTLFLTLTLTLSICPFENKIMDSTLTLNLILNYNKNIKTLILNLTMLYYDHNQIDYFTYRV